MKRPNRTRLILSPLVVFLGCTPPDEAVDEIRSAVTVPSKGTGTTFDIASWNLEWFGDTGNGPTNESLQLSNVRDVIAGTDFDLWGLVEVVSESQFASLKSQLSGYAGFLANDPGVIDGPAYYSDFSNTEQKVALLYKSSIVSVSDKRVILTANDYDFGGRPPLQVTMEVTLNGTTQPLVVIVLHAKCCTDRTSFQRRQNASNALKAYLDNTFPTQKVAVIGDWNDDLDTSIRQGSPSPYANFVGDTSRYSFPTKALTDAHISTTTDYPDAIDHHLNTDEENATYVAGSVEAYRVDQYVPSYGTTTSDHYPVLSRYEVSGSGGSGGGGGTGGTGGTGGSGGGAQVILNEILANESGGNTAGEFIEVLSVGPDSADLSGWTLSDSIDVRHTFAAGTTLLPGKAIVVFAGASAIPGGLTNAVAASTGALGLNNGGDTVRLKEASGVQIDGLTYPSSLSGTDGVSMNRNPDGSATGTFVLHTAISSLTSSPGKRASGADW